MIPWTSPSLRLSYVFLSLAPWLPGFINAAGCQFSWRHTQRNQLATKKLTHGLFAYHSSVICEMLEPSCSRCYTPRDARISSRTVCVYVRMLSRCRYAKESNDDTNIGRHAKHHGYRVLIYVYRGSLGPAFDVPDIVHVSLWVLSVVGDPANASVL